MNKDDKNVNARLDNIKVIRKRFITERDHIKRIEIMKRIDEYNKNRSKNFKENLLGSLGLKLKRKIFFIDLIISFLIILNLTLSFVSNWLFTSEYEYENGYKKEIKKAYVSTDLIENLKWVIVAIVILMELLLILKYLLKLKFLRRNQLACKEDNIFTTMLIKKMIIEIIVLGIFSPPYCNSIIHGDMIFGRYTYSSDSIILIFTIFKLYYLVYLFQNYSIWSTEKARIIAKNYNVSIYIDFLFKAQIKRSPLFTIFIIFIVSLCIFSCIIRVFEYGYSNDNSHKDSKGIINDKYKSYADNFWMIIISMMTIGYGDIYPETHLGRVIIFFSAIVGMLVLSLLVVTLNNLIDFSKEEYKAYNLIVKDQANKSMKKMAIKLIKSIMKLVEIKKDIKVLKNQSK